ncbi:hypothetical protein DH2020_007705 [Rehmannia glutinosa]|uniref:Uncharacterized protein n=1 Tax=Rehmannia glutinosa TaxID=99300 RepID=A0ABR0TZR3_REHGL
MNGSKYVLIGMARNKGKKKTQAEEKVAVLKVGEDKLERKAGGKAGTKEFIEIISARFEELKEAKIIAEFNKLKHTGSYHDYVEKFEELKACMLLLNNGDFSEEYFIARFISGLSEELQAFVTMFEPVTLQQTIELGRKQLLTLEALTKKIRTPMKPFTNIYPNTRKPDAVPIQNSKPNSMSSPRQPIKLLTIAEMAARRDKGLCYNCDEKFTFGHRCKQRINYMIMTEDEELAYLQDTPATEAIYEPPQEQMDEIQMTLNAISGEDGLTTMRLFGQCGEHMLHILIDSGSTLSFIQEATAKRLGCKLTPAKPLLVKVANGQRLVSSQKAEDFTWEMQGNNFAYSLRLLKNEGCDLILGGDWLKACTPIELDYDKMTFTVTLKGRRVKLQALTSITECQFISGHSLFELLHMNHEEQVEAMYVLTVQDSNSVADPKLLSLLSRFEEVLIGMARNKGKKKTQAEEKVAVLKVEKIS